MEVAIIPLGTHAMLAAPRMPNLNASLLFGVAGGLKAPQMRPIMAAISSSILLSLSWPELVFFRLGVFVAIRVDGKEQRGSLKLKGTGVIRHHYSSSPSFAAR